MNKAQTKVMETLLKLLQDSNKIWQNKFTSITDYQWTVPLIPINWFPRDSKRKEDLRDL